MGQHGSRVGLSLIDVARGAVGAQAPLVAERTRFIRARRGNHFGHKRRELRLMSGLQAQLQGPGNVSRQHGLISLTEIVRQPILTHRERSRFADAERALGKAACKQDGQGRFQ